MNPKFATEPDAGIRTMASSAWDMYRALVERGFTESQAIHLIGVMLGTAIGARPAGDSDQR